MIDRNTGQSRLIGFVRFVRRQTPRFFCRFAGPTATDINVSFAPNRFELEADASRALKELQGHILEESAAPLQIKYADSERQKEQRRARNQQIQQNTMIPQFPPGSPLGVQYWPVPVGAGPPIPWWLGQPGTSPPGALPHYPGLPPGWGMPPYGMPVAGFAVPPGDGNLSAHGGPVAGGEMIPPAFPPDFSHSGGGNNEMTHFPPHLMGHHMLPNPAMMPYDPLMLQMQSLSMSPPTNSSMPHHPGHFHFSGDALSNVSPVQARKRNGTVVGAGGEIVDS